MALSLTQEVLSVPEAIEKLRTITSGQTINTLQICSTKGLLYSSSERKLLVKLLSQIKIKHLTLIDFPYCPPDFLGPMHISGTFYEILHSIHAEHLSLQNSFNCSSPNIFDKSLKLPKDTVELDIVCSTIVHDSLNKFLNKLSKQSTLKVCTLNNVDILSPKTTPKIR